MRKTYLFLGISAIVLLGIGYALGWIDNGPRKIEPVDVSKVPSRLDE